MYRFCSEYNHLFLFKLPGQCFEYVIELNVTIQNDVFIVNLKYFYSLVNSRHATFTKLQLWETVPQPPNNLYQRQQAQNNRYAYTGTNFSPAHGTDEMFEELSVFKNTSNIYEANILKWVYKCLSELSIPILSSYHQRHHEWHDRNARNMNRLHIPAAATTALVHNVTRNKRVSLWKIYLKK